MSAQLWRRTIGSGARHIVLLADADRSAASWPPELVDALLERSRLTLIDLADQGRSPHGGSWSVEQHAACVAEALTEVSGDEALDVVGHGLGGAVGLALASRHAAVRSVVSVNSSMWLVEPALPGPEEMLVVQLMWRQRDGVVGDQDLVDWLVREQRALLEPDLDAVDRDPEALRTWLRTWLDWGFNPRCRHRADWLASPPVGPPLPQCSVAFVHGSDNPLIDVAHSHAAAAYVPGATLHVVHGAGHALGPKLVGTIADLV